jgi:hypothetical protein
MILWLTVVPQIFMCAHAHFCIWLRITRIAGEAARYKSMAVVDNQHFVDVVYFVDS